MNQKDWINSVMESMHQHQPVQPSDGLLARINQKLAHRPKTASLTWTMSMAAGFALLIIANTFALINLTGKDKNGLLENTQSIEFSTNNQLYSDG
jgi:hypothetical protein